MSFRTLLFFVLLGAFCFSCITVAPPPSSEPAPEPAPAPAPSGGHQPVYTPAPVQPGHLVLAAPKRFLLHLGGASLVYDPQSGTLQITDEGNVLSYGSDWQVHKLKPYLYHLRLGTWQGFYWMVNTSRREAYRVRGGTFGQVGGSQTRLGGLNVEVVGGGPGGMQEPDRFLLRFKTSDLVYVPDKDVLQLAAFDNVLSYCSDWQRCRVNTNLYDLRQTNWKGFFWKVNTASRKAWRTTDGDFCHPGGSDELLHIKVSVVR
jgi:hypothetical protein